jgi:elongation factor G-like protein
MSRAERRALVEREDPVSQQCRLLAVSRSSTYRRPAEVSETDRVTMGLISSGRFQRGMKLKNIRTGRQMSVQAPVFFLARERNLAEEAWPDDIIGQLSSR